MLITFTVPAAYVAIIAFAYSFVYGMIGFGVLSPFVADPDLLASVFMPSWLIALGIGLIVIEYWWRLGNDKVELYIIMFSPKIWGGLIAIGGIYMFIDYIIKNGFTKEVLASVIFTLIMNAIFVGIFFLRRHFYLKKHGSQK